MERWTRRCRTPLFSLRQTRPRATAISRFRATFSTRLLAGSRSSRLTVTTYPGMEAANDKDFDALKAEIYAAFPAYAREGILNNGPAGLAQISPDLYEAYEEFGGIPSLLQIPFVPFQFDINASATTLTQPEFVAQQTQLAEELRAAILSDSTAPLALQNLAANQTTFENLYLAGLEEAGELLTGRNDAAGGPEPADHELDGHNGDWRAGRALPAAESSRAAMFRSSSASF